MSFSLSIFRFLIYLYIYWYIYWYYYVFDISSSIELNVAKIYYHTQSSLSNFIAMKLLMYYIKNHRGIKRCLLEKFCFSWLVLFGRMNFRIWQIQKMPLYELSVIGAFQCYISLPKHLFLYIKYVWKKYSIFSITCIPSNKD